MKLIRESFFNLTCYDSEKIIVGSLVELLKWVVKRTNMHMKIVFGINVAIIRIATLFLAE